MSDNDPEPDPRQHRQPNTHVRRWGAVLLGAKHILFRVDAEDMERLEAKVDRISRQLDARDSVGPTNR